MLLTNPMGVGIRDLLRDNIHHGGDEFLPMIGSIGIFILFCNLISVFRALSSYRDSTVPLGCAMIVFVYYNYVGVAKRGFEATQSTFWAPFRSWL